MKSFKKNYHWVIAAMALLQLLIYGGAVNNFTSYHVVPVTEALGISRTMFSLAGSVRGVVGVFSTILTGTLIEKLGYRKTAGLGLAACALAYVLLSTMTAYWQLALGCGLIGLASGICATSGVSRLLNLWFHRWRGTVLGIVTAATGVGSTLLGLIQAYAIDNISWRMSFTIVAGLLFAVSLLVFLFVRNTPEDIGLKPFGWGEKLEIKKKNDRWEGYSMQELKKNPAFYILTACALLSVYSVISTSYNFVPYFQDCGMTATRASKLYGTMMLVLGGVKLFCGFLCDTIGAKRVAIICHVSCAVGLALVMLLPQTDIAMIAAMIVFDFAMPLTTLIFPLVSVEMFGYRAQNQFVGIVMSMTSAASIISGPIANYIRDCTGSYIPVFITSMVIALSLVVVYLIMYALADRAKKKYVATVEK
ncbi:MAG: MFS transporter [Oscillospiraceae bacterium]|nr:MFS transporter [Oscillospiraceae bacterium]